MINISGGVFVHKRPSLCLLLFVFFFGNPMSLFEHNNKRAPGGSNEYIPVLSTLAVISLAITLPIYLSMIKSSVSSLALAGEGIGSLSHQAANFNKRMEAESAVRSQFAKFFFVDGDVISDGVFGSTLADLSELISEEQFENALVRIENSPAGAVQIFPAPPSLPDTRPGFLAFIQFGLVPSIGQFVEVPQSPSLVVNVKGTDSDVVETLGSAVIMLQNITNPVFQFLTEGQNTLLFTKLETRWKRDSDGVFRLTSFEEHIVRSVPQTR